MQKIFFLNTRQGVLGPIDIHKNSSRTNFIEAYVTCLNKTELSPSWGDPRIDAVSFTIHGIIYVTQVACAWARLLSECFAKLRMCLAQNLVTRIWFKNYLYLIRHIRRKNNRNIFNTVNSKSFWCIFCKSVIQ